MEVVMQFRIIDSEDPKYQKEKLLRWEAFNKTMGLPPGSEEIPNEANSLHLVALDKKSVVGCVVFHSEGAECGCIDQFAISDEYQGQSFGRKMMVAMENELIKRGIKEIYINAQQDGMPFYIKMGYRPISEQHDGVQTWRKLRKKLRK